MELLQWWLLAKILTYVFVLKQLVNDVATGRPQTAKRAIERVEHRLSKDGWPEYYDGKAGRYVRKQARKYQTWSISGYLVAKLMIENPTNLSLIPLEEDKKIAKPRLTRFTSF
ncbi:hypothetical protein PRUPE_6G314000 [Prunus persica]|uniref:Uncharacterized protein n=1 Tax=Prunus persica TaxID=3760 RepID=A0A251NYF6_PRUPE|nr:hypothetical protein PRUPE_6G314000 [Prunus persica]